MFSIGNPVAHLVTLLVVVAVLLVYRRIDLNSRSIDKVRRYADRVSARMERLIDQKMAAVKDLSIEVQVNLKAGQEVLKRVRAVQQELSGGADRAERLDQRLHEYDATLGELGRTSAGVEQELARLRADADRLAAAHGRAQAAATTLDERVAGLVRSVAAAEENGSRLLAQEHATGALDQELARVGAVAEQVSAQLGTLHAERDRIAQVAGDSRRLGQTLEGLQPRVQAMQDTVATLQERVQTLIRGTDRSEQALAALARLDTTMTELEQRAQRLQRARTWLADTESRLEQINRGAQEQVRLLGTLLRNEEDGGSAAAGPPLGKRESVDKLARQGWSVPEIARATRLSRGEVELILEVSASTAS